MFGIEFKNLYYAENQISSGYFSYEFISISKYQEEYFVALFRPSLSGAKSYSVYCIGVMEGNEMILDNGETIYAIKPKEDGSIFYYAIKDEHEYPGQYFYPVEKHNLHLFTKTYK